MVRQSDFIRVSAQQEDLAEVKKLIEHYGGKDFNSQTIHKNTDLGKEIGFLGEKITYNFLKEQDFHQSIWVTSLFQRNYDCDILYRGYKIDVKTKLRNVPCQVHYEASVPIRKTETDIYVFVSIYQDKESKSYQVELLGWLEKENIPKNTKPLNTWNGFVPKLEAYQFYYQILKPFPELYSLAPKTPSLQLC